MAHAGTLDIRGLNKQYEVQGEALPVLQDINLTIGQTEIAGLIGPNGAGKSTTLNTLAGLLKPRSGSITFEGRNLLGMKAHKLVSQGMALCPEGRRIFQLMTVREKAHSAQIVERLLLTDPQVAARVRQYAGAYGGTISDPALRQGEGLALLSQLATREATVLAYADVFRVIAALSLLVFAYLLALRLREDARARRAALLTPVEAA